MSPLAYGMSALGIEFGETLLSLTSDGPDSFLHGRALREINGEVLALLGCSWDSITPISRGLWEKPELKAKLMEAIQIVRTRLDAVPIWGFNDPSTARLLPFWQELLKQLGALESYILIIRNPVSVARSLSVSNGFSIEKSYLLWLQNYVTAYKNTSGKLRMVVDYDLTFAEPAKQLRRIADGLNLPLDSSIEDTIDEFFKSLPWCELHRADLAPSDAYLDSRVPELVGKTNEVFRDLMFDQFDNELRSTDGAIARAETILADFTPFVSQLERLEINRNHVGRELVTARERSNHPTKKILQSRYVTAGPKGEPQPYNAEFTMLQSASPKRTMDSGAPEKQICTMERARDFSYARLAAIVEQSIRLRIDLESERKGHLATSGELEKAKAQLASQTGIGLEPKEAELRIDEERRRYLALARRLLRMQRKLQETFSSPGWKVIVRYRRWLDVKRAHHPRFMRRYEAIVLFFLQRMARVSALSDDPISADLKFELGALTADDPDQDTPPAMISMADLSATCERTRTRVLYISGEPETPGNAYRVVRQVEAATMAGAHADWMSCDQAAERLNEIAAANIVVIWRAPWDDRIASIVDRAHSNGVLVVFDVDDLMIDPALARAETIDAIRTMRLSEDDVYTMYKNVQRTMLASDVCTATTVELASHVRRFHKTCYVVPNCFDETTWSASRLAVRRRRAQPSDGLIRIGYAGGTRTHQKDFAVVVDAVAHVLRERENCRLVLFRWSEDKQPVVYADEFASMSGLEHQIEWRDLVPLRELPEEMARFDINLAPLEVGNPFCEAKSELKFFEAALVDVCTIASPTGPFKRSIRDGINGFLATDQASWYTILLSLVDDPGLRSRISHAAYYDALQMFGPRRLTDETGSLMEQLKGGESAARAFELSLLRGARGLSPAPKVPESEVMFATDCLQAADVTVVIPLYNYAHYVTEALNSVYSQTLKVLDLVVVDDQSNDESLSVVLEWVKRNAKRFNRVQVLRNRVNSGLGLTRNTGFEAAETPFVLPLDADNRLLPECCEACLQEIRRSNAAFAYPTIRKFGDSVDLMGTSQYWPQRLAGGNYIDAMAMISKTAWVLVGGYDRMVHNGWEDYDFWCRLAERGLFGHSVERVLAEYRVHEQSMLRTTTDPGDNKRRLIADVQQRHAWTTVPDPMPMQKSMISAAVSLEATVPPNTNAALVSISSKPE